MNIAIYSRLLQFSAGPNAHRFYACYAHHADLVKGEAGGLFVPTPDEPIRLEDKDDDYPCDFCREG